MCGVAGFYTQREIDSPEKILSGMLEMIAYRGKDHRGIFFDKDVNLDYTLGIGHNRLSVIDLSEKGNQPYLYKEYIIAYNGEIYNYQELRKDLMDKGYKFESKSDTEVIIKLFDIYGKDSFEKLNGMFAIVIFDKNKRKLYLSRDRMGVKPLLFYKNKDSFLFSSELKSFFAFPNFKNEIRINKNMIANYFKFGYVNSFKSIIDGVQKVENGTIVTFDLQSGKIESSNYWRLLKKQEKNQINDFEIAKEELYGLLKSSISMRLVSDIPVGLFLSSGIDSNLVLNFSLLTGLKKIDTYTLKSLDFEDNKLLYDNRVNRKFIDSDYDTIWKDYKFLCSKYDEPFSDPATIGLYELSKYASAHNKVIMVGDGGDELLGGYSSYKDIAKSAIDKRVLFIKKFYWIINPFIRVYIRSFVEKKSTKRLRHYHSILSSKTLGDIFKVSESFYDSFTYRIVGHIYSEPGIKYKNSDSLLTLLNYKTSTELIHQLNYKTDIAGMLNTVEIREPLLDYRLFEFQQKLSASFINEMVGKNDSKELFRKILSEKFEAGNVNKLQKKGFHVNLESAFRKNIEEIDSLVFNHVSDLIDMGYVQKIWLKWKKNKIDFIIVNRIITFLLWEKNFNAL